MSIPKILVVSNHSNHDLEWLEMTYDYGFSPENTIIYDRTPDDFPNKSKIDHLGKIIPSPNVGSNLYDIGRFIVDHYDNLPDMMIHIKGNLLQKKDVGYTTKERFIYALKSNWFVPIDGGKHIQYSFPYVVNNNLFSLPMEWEVNNYTMRVIFSEEDFKKAKTYPRISNFIEFMKDIFVMGDDEVPKFISFAPAANYAVPKNCILKYSKNFYKKMMHYTDYNDNPVEAHWYERILQLAWQGCLEENMSYIVD
jgi:hypothetical protein